MNYIVDTSVIISVITNEEHKEKIIKLTKGADLIAPSTLHWELGNAFSAMIKRKRISLKQAFTAIDAYQKIPVRFSDIELDTALEISARLKVYAYDAYFIGCALKHKYPLITLDRSLLEVAKRAGANVKEVKS